MNKIQNDKPGGGIPNFNNHTRRKRLHCANSKFTSLRLARIRTRPPRLSESDPPAMQGTSGQVTKTGKYEEPAPNLQSVFVLNFENWDL